MTEINEAAELAVFEPAETGELSADGGGLFADYWGTIVDYGMTTSSYNGRMTRQLQFEIRMDNGMSRKEWFPLPTETDGSPKMKAGKLARPTRTSKWGIQETRLGVLPIPWGGKLEGLVGLHAHFQLREFSNGEDVTDLTKAEKDAERFILKGNFIVEADTYNNEVRDAKGLSTLTVGTNSVTTAPVASGDEKSAIALLIDQGNYIKYVDEVSKNPSLAEYGSKAIVEKWENDGKVTREFVQDKGVIYKAGPSL
mgnify:CR=1 FL=1